MMTAITFEAFPELKPRAKAVVADAQIRHSELERRVKNLKLWQWVFGLTMLLALAVGLAVGVNFNEALLSNTRAELTSADWWLRFASAFAMEATLLAGVWGVHTAFKRDQHLAMRIIGFLLGSILLAGVFFLAASIGYSKFSSLLDTLWQGSNASTGGSTQSFELGAQSSTPVDIPFILRLASSVMFLGAGMLAAFMEIGWILTTDRLSVVREQVAKYTTVLNIHKTYETAQAKFFETKEEKKNLEDEEYRNARAYTVFLGGVDNYRKQIEAARLKPINAALVDRPTYERHQADLAKTDVCLKSADDVMSNSSKILEFIERRFPFRQSKAVDTLFINDTPSADPAKKE